MKELETCYHNYCERPSKKPKSKSPKATKILVAVALFLTVLSYFIQSGSTEPTDTSSMTGVLLISVAALVGLVSFCMSIYDIGAAGKGRRAKRVIFTITIPFYGFGAILLGSLLFTNGLSQPATNADAAVGGQVQANSVVQDPEIVSLLKSVGAKGDFSDLELLWSDGDMQKDCGWAESEGCYKWQGDTHQLILKRSDDARWLKVSAAHEYLHYVWRKNDLESDQRLNSYLIDFYGKNPQFQNRITTHYVDNAALNTTEFFSYGCTEVADVRLGGYIAGRCNEFIDTSTLAAMY